MDKPLVSVVMSVFNAERYLKEAMDSILQQTFTGFEFIITDDCSTDSSRNILCSYEDKRIIVINNETNRGLTPSLNVGIGKARGRYLARMDADDISDYARLQKEVDFLEGNRGHAAVGSFANVIDKHSRLLRQCPHPVDDKAVRRYLKRDNCLTHGSVMIRMDCLQESGLYDETISRAQDYDLWLRLSERYCLANIPEYLYSFRVHPDSIGERFREEQKRCVLLAKEKAFRRAAAAFLKPDGAQDNQPVESGTPAAGKVVRNITDYVAGYLIDTEFQRRRYLPVRWLLKVVQVLTLGRLSPENACRRWAALRYSQQVGTLLKRCLHQGTPSPETARALASCMARILQQAMKPKG